MWCAIGIIGAIRKKDRRITHEIVSSGDFIGTVARTPPICFAGGLPRLIVDRPTRLSQSVHQLLEGVAFQLTDALTGQAQVFADLA
jgi:hypothetical protein